MTDTDAASRSTGPEASGRRHRSPGARGGGGGGRCHRPRGRRGSVRRCARAARRAGRRGLDRCHPQGAGPGRRRSSQRWRSWRCSPPSCSPQRATGWAWSSWSPCWRHPLPRPIRPPPDPAALRAQAVPGAGRPGPAGRPHHEPEVRRREGRAVRPGRRVPAAGHRARRAPARGRPARARRERHRPRRRRARHGRRRRVAGAGRLGGRWRPTCRWCACPPAPATTSRSTSASTATTSSARSTPSTRRSSGASTSPR